MYSDTVSNSVDDMPAVAAERPEVPGSPGVPRWRGTLHRILSIAFIPTVLAVLRHKAFRLIQYSGTTVYLPRGSLGGKGRLSIGKRWFGQPPAPTSVVALKGGRIIVDGNFVVHRGADIRIGNGATLHLGSGYLADNVHIDCHSGVSIGHGVAIAKGTIIMDTDHHTLEGQRSISAPVRIGNHVWIGARVLILKGVTIGDGAVIAAGALVAADVEPGMLYARAPAKPVRPTTWKI